MERERGRGRLDGAGASMTRAQVFPALLIGLDVCAAAVYGLDGDARRSIYWLAAAVLTAAVTF